GSAQQSAVRCSGGSGAGAAALGDGAASHHRRSEIMTVDLPFGTREFFTVFERYNSAIWPMQVALLGVALAILGFAIRPARVRSHAAMLNDMRSEEHTSELQSRGHLVCRLLLEKKKPRP